MTKSETPLTEPASRFWRLPVIRHIRWVWYCWRVADWQTTWSSVGYVNSSFDGRVLDQMRRGIV